MDNVEQQIAQILAEGMGDDNSQPVRKDSHDEQETADIVDHEPTVEEILAGEHDSNEPVEEQEQAPEEDTTEPDDDGVSLKDIADKLGVEPKDLYDELVIPLGDDKTVTLGEFKDRVKELQDVDQVKQEVSDREADLERESLQMRAELNQLMNMIPEEMREPLIRESTSRHANYLQEQQAAVLEAIPAWKDHDSLAKDRDAIVDLGNSYGFSSQEMTFTQDARVLRMLHDFVRLRERSSNADANSKREAKTRPGKPGKKQSGRGGGKLKQAIQRAKASPDSRVAESVVSQLIRSQ